MDDIFSLESSAPPPHFSALAWGFRAARLLHVAVRLNLFTVLDERPCDAYMLAKQLNTNGEMTERVLVALAGLGLVRHDMDTWRNTLAASLYLVKEQPLYQGDVIELAAQEWDQYTHLERLIREGRSENPFSWGHTQKQYLRAIHGLTIAGLAQRLARLVPLAGRGTLLDVGGAPGTWSVALAQRYPALRITLTDIEDTAIETLRVIGQFDLAKRLTLKTVKAVAWREKSFGQNQYEAVLLSRLAIGVEGTTLSQLMRAHEALKAGGVVIVHAYLLDNDLNGSGEAVYKHLLGETCTLEQLISLLEEAGFERVSVLHRHPADGDLLVGYKVSNPLPVEPPELVEAATPELSLVGAGTADFDEDVILATHRRAWSGVIERLN
jgi:precorrin-6B methylase 2